MRLIRKPLDSKMAQCGSNGKMVTPDLCAEVRTADAAFCWLSILAEKTVRGKQHLFHEAPFPGLPGAPIGLFSLCSMNLDRPSRSVFEYSIIGLPPHINFVIGRQIFVLDSAVRNRCSSHVTVVPKGKLGFSKGVLVRDPDGHAMLLIQE